MGQVDRSHIRVKAMFVAVNDEGTSHAVSVNPPTEENPHGYHRLIGGSVELGETHRQAVLREVQEEVGATIGGLTYLGCLENIFRLDGELGHEIVFMYTGRLNPPLAASGATLTEIDGSVVPMVWRPVDAEDNLVPLYPTGAQPLVAEAARAQHDGN